MGEKLVFHAKIGEFWSPGAHPYATLNLKVEEWKELKDFYPAMHSVWRMIEKEMKENKKVKVTVECE